MDDNELDTAQRNQKTAPIVILVSAFVAAALTALILLFSFQKGLPLSERCHCAMNKVYFYSGFSFLSVLLQFICYQTDKAYCLQFSGLDVSDWLNTHAIEGKKKSILKVVIMTVLTAGAEFFLLTFLIDQNQDFLWFFHHGAAGILCFAGTFLVNLTGAMIACLKMPYRAW